MHSVHADSFLGTILLLFLLICIIDCFISSSKKIGTASKNSFRELRITIAFIFHWWFCWATAIVVAPPAAKEEKRFDVRRTSKRFCTVWQSICKFLYFHQMDFDCSYCTHIILLFSPSVLAFLKGFIGRGIRKPDFGKEDIEDCLPWDEYLLIYLMSFMR